MASHLALSLLFEPLPSRLRRPSGDSFSLCVFGRTGNPSPSVLVDCVTKPRALAESAARPLPPRLPRGRRREEGRAGVASAATVDAERPALALELGACGAAAVGAREGRPEGDRAELRPRHALKRASGCIASTFNFLPSAAAVPFPRGAWPDLSRIGVPVCALPATQLPKMDSGVYRSSREQGR
jgi:hypothetical protein